MRILSVLVSFAIFCTAINAQESKLNPITNPTVAELQKNFAAPGRDFSTGPLWTWNDRLTEEQVRGTIRDLAGQHVKQVWVHPRPGLMTPYLSEEWFARWNAALDEAQKLDMNVWIYDENSYPSGFAGGLVPDAMPESRGRGLRFEEVAKLDTLGGDIEYIFDADGKNITEQIKKAGKLAPQPDGKKYLLTRNQYSGQSGWYGGKWHVDLLKKGVTEKFLDITLEAYAKAPAIRKEFGKRVPGIFTDEPHPAFGLAGGTIAWNDEIPAAFEKKFGYSLVDNLPSLNKPVGDYKKVRHNFHQIVLDLFIENWSKPYFERCEKYALQFTGHYWEHGWPGTSHGPDNMAMYAWHQRPAIDLLMNTYNDSNSGTQFGNVRSVKELASIANQLGRSRTLSENYGAGGWDIRFEDLKRLGDWSYALGVNTNNEHLSYVTIRGARKRDHPQSFSYHANWFKGYHVLEDYFTRLSYVLSQGRQVNHVLVIEPTTTAWMYQGTPELGKIGQSFTDLVNALERSQVEYDLASEDVIKRFGKVSDSGNQARRILRRNRNTVDNAPVFSVNKGHYDLVIIPPYTENLDAVTVKQLTEYVKNGGQLLVCGDLPVRIDGKESKMPAEIQSRCRKVTPDEAVKITAERTAKTGSSITAEPQRGVFHHRRILKDGEVLFICNSNQNQPAEVEIKSDKPFQEWNLFTGQPAATAADKITLPPSGSILLVSGKKTRAAATEMTPAETNLPAGSPITIKRLEDNVLTLDYVDVKVGGEEKKDVYTWAANRWIFQKHGFGANPWDHQVQFKDELIKKTFPADSGFEAAYHFTLQDDVTKNLSIVIERPDLYKIFCNEIEVKAMPDVWWLDRSFGKIDLSKAAQTGENTVKIVARPMTIEHELEPAYLLGNFSLQNAEKGFVVTAAKALEFAKEETPEEIQENHSDAIEGVAWLSGGVPADKSPSLEFTFGKEEPVAAVRIWNYNEQNLQSRGVKSVEITGLGKVDLPLADGKPVVLPLASPQPLKTISFKILSNYSGISYPVAEKTKPADDGYVGISEVQFLTKSANGQLTAVKDVKVKASSELATGGFDRRAAHLVDGSGIGAKTAAQGWKVQGMPFYSGEVEYSQQFPITKIDAKKRYYVKLPESPNGWYGATAQIVVNGKAAGFVISAPWKTDVTKLLKDGDNTVSVIVYGTPKNLLGPHHTGQLRGSAWPGMFHKAPEHQPGGAAYDTIGYGLFEKFVLSVE